MRKLACVTLIAALAFAACHKSNQKAPENPSSPQPTGAPTSAPSSSSSSQPAPSADAPVQEAAAPIPAPSFSDPKLQRGYMVFQKWCAPCHAPGPLHPGTQALAVKYKGTDTPDALEKRTDLTPDMVKTFVRGGVSIMPPFRKTEITDSELDDLAAYLSRQH